MSARFFFSIFTIIFLIVLSLPFAPAFGTPDPDQSNTTPPAAPEPKLVTLQSDKLTLNQALTDLAKQTGIRVEDARGLPDQPLHLDLKRVSFWQAVDAIAAATKARVNLYPTTGRIALAKRGANYRLPPISYDGRFRLSVKKVTTSRDLEVGEDAPGHGATNVTIEIAWDPKLQPLYLETRPHKVRLVDDKNNVLTVPEDGSSLAPVDGLIALGLDLHLPVLPRNVSKISSLKGQLSMIGPSKMLTFHFDRLDRIAKANANDPERSLRQEGVTCRILDVKLRDDHWTVQVALDYPPVLKQLDSNQSWVVNNEMTLEALDGKKRFASSNYALELATARRAVLSYHFRDKSLMRDKLRNWKLSYRAPANLIEAPIAFAFKDIPLP
ncbi:MAG TPA: hypothetical protein VH592_04535 [Gemmataceae bacterium]|jgi:hypothetical protein